MLIDPILKIKYRSESKSPFFEEITKAAIAVDDALDYVTLNMMNGCSRDQSAGM